MPADKAPRALVVDDELIIRRLIVKALAQQGFVCDSAVDGDEASRMLAAQHFDLLITDLKMPNRNGHALIRDVLASSDRPIIIAHTGVVEPKLARDLFSRGIDDIIYKPADPFLVAAKALTLVERRSRENRSGRSSGESAASASVVSRLEGDADPVVAKIDMPGLNARLAEISSVLPVSNAALDVYQMTRTCDWRISQIAAAIQRDAALAAEVLRLANSSFYNASSKRIVNLDQAVTSLGQFRIGELAVAISALAVATPAAVPWMNLELAWKRSMAAGVAVESLLELGGHASLDEGLSLGATMYPLGRVILSASFPKLYQRLIDQCWRSGDALRDLERQSLPMTHTATLAQLLTSWRIPPDVCAPLKYAADDFATLTRLPEPSRTKAELLKLAVFVGRLAVGGWETWDAVELVPAAVLERLKTPIVDDLIAKIRSDAMTLAVFSPDGTAPVVEDQPPPPLRSVAYCNVADSCSDLLAELLPALGYQPRPVRIEELRELEEPAIINGLDSPATRFAAHRGRVEAIVVTTGEKVGAYAKFGRTIVLPCSFGRLRHALIDVLGAAPTAPQSLAPARRKVSCDEEQDLIGAANL